MDLQPGSIYVLMNLLLGVFLAGGINKYDPPGTAFQKKSTKAQDCAKRCILSHPVDTPNYYISLWNDVVRLLNREVFPTAQAWPPSMGLGRQIIELPEP